MGRVWLTRLGPFTAQAAAIFAASFALSLLTWRYQLRTPLNWAWIVGLPVLVAILFNSEKALRLRMAIVLTAISFVAVGFAAAALGYP